MSALKDDAFVIDDSILDVFQRMKRSRISSVRETLKKVKKIQLKEFIARAKINWGIHERTIREYLDALETIEEITIKDGMITCNLEMGKHEQDSETL